MEKLSSQLVIFKLSTLGKNLILFIPCSVNMCKIWSIKKNIMKGKFMCVFREEEHMTERWEGHGTVEE